MAEGTFAEFIARERARLAGEREAIFTSQQELDAKLADINRELAAIDAYEAAKSGKAIPIRGVAPRASRAAARGRRASKREALLSLIKGSAGGLSRGEILERMGLKGDKAGEMSVSNTLTALTKANQVVRAEGRYRVV